jgi:hypothetical protein
MRSSLLLLTLVLSTAQSALAIAVGGKLYVKSKDTPLLKDPKASSAKLTTLQPGTEVTWKGASAKDKQFQEVEANGKKGFVLTSNLSPQQPQQEFDGSVGKPMSAQAFANSGAATKDGPPRTQYQGSSAAQEAAAELIYVEELNKAKATPQALEAKNKALH